MTTFHIQTSHFYLEVKDEILRNNLEGLSVNYWKLLLKGIFLLSGKNILWEILHLAFPKETIMNFNWITLN